ncbi:MAG: hypothetical protein AAGK97_15835, partial [Bacteroidota bacterium]
MQKGLFLCFIILLSSQLYSQQLLDKSQYEVTSSKMEYLGKSRPIMEIPPVDGTTPEEKAAYKKLKQAPENFKGRGFSKVVHPELEHHGLDPLVELQNHGRSPENTLQVLSNLDGLETGFSSPGDPTGAAGSKFYVQAINATTVGVFNKNGTLAQTF